jgi:hypothetical protein
LSFFRRRIVEQSYLRRAEAPSDQLRDFWFRQFRRHFEAEEVGVDPAGLSTRWLAIDAMTWERRGPRVQIEIPEDVTHFLDDADIRAKDQSYASHQRRKVREWLDAR